MRMWMVDPRLLCLRHLLGEHRDVHQLVGCLRLGRSIKGHLMKRYIDPSSIYMRHSELEKELEKRGAHLKSPLNVVECVAFGHWHGVGFIDQGKSLFELSTRCEKCRFRISNFVRNTIGRSANYIPGERK